MDKVFRTNNESISPLVSRGVDISTPKHHRFAQKALQREGYYNLINVYHKLFLITKYPDDRYRSGTTVEEIFALYDFDRKLRNIVFEYILSVEHNIKKSLGIFIF